MAGEILQGAQQENLLALLAHSAEHGRIIANMLDPQLCEGDYQLIAERLLEYWREYEEPPRQHVPDLLADILEDKGNRKAQTFRTIIAQMQALADSAPNAQYVINTLQQFSRLQRMKDALYRGAEVLNKPGPTTINDVEGILRDVMTARDFAFDPGATLHQIERYLERMRTTASEFSSGIPLLDQRHVIPARGKLFNMLAPSGYGKTWFLCGVGRANIMQRKRVCHLSLEVDEEDLIQRYYQCLFSVTKREAETKLPVFKRNKRGEFQGIETTDHTPAFTFASPELGMEMQARLMQFGQRWFNYLRIKRFPTRSLTIDGMCAYLDGLADIEGFIPDLLIVDYPGIMKTDVKNHRLTLGRVFEEFRGVLVERNMAGAVVHQTSKAGMAARRTSVLHTGEDFSIIQTSDVALTYSATPQERRRGLARLYVDKARTERDGWGILITQAYDVGQFTLDQMYLPSGYDNHIEVWGKRDAKKGHDDPTDDDDAEYDDGDEAEAAE